MVHYEVTVEVAPGMADAFERYMRAKHIPEILATGCFAAVHFQRGDGGRFRTDYAAASRGDLDRYLTEHAGAFRADFQTHFPEGASVAREVWTDLEAWG